jgi:hypothetical protein
MIKLKSILLEYVDQSIITLSKYLNSSEKSKVEETIDFIGLDRFLTWFIDADKNGDYDVHILYDYDDDEEEMFMDAADADLRAFKSKYPEMYKDMMDYVTQKGFNEVITHAFDIYPPDLPSWYFLSQPQIIKNQWLVHCTTQSDVLSIKNNGFIKGVDDYSKLGLTTWFKGDSTMKGRPGYNFAYTVEDFERFGYYSYSNLLKYGDSIVIFRASGLRCWHRSDMEYQVIFNGKLATDIVPVFNMFDTWTIYGKGGKALYGSTNMMDVVNWVDANYSQYRKSIAWEKPRA